MPSRPVILDCDPGHDDALAILLALARPELRVLGITTVAGNSGIENTHPERAARPDAPRPDGRPSGGRGGAARSSGPSASPITSTEPPASMAPTLPEAAVGPVAEEAVELLARLVRASPDPVTLVPTGPLTNIALFVRTHPELLPRISEISIMGGAIREGNSTASAEFNIWAVGVGIDRGRFIDLLVDAIARFP